MMINEMLATLGLVLSTFVPLQNDAPAQGQVPPQWDCKPARWTIGPVIRDGKYLGELAADCWVKDGPGGGQLALLSAYFVRRTREAYQVHSGPKPELYEGMPSVYFDVTYRPPGTDSTYVRQDVHLATNLMSELRYDAFSRQVKAEGLADNVEKIDVSIGVTSTMVPATFAVTVKSFMRVDKPWYVPSGIFRSKVSEVAASQFESLVNTTVPEISRAL